MARTKEELIVILAKHKKNEFFQSSTWADLVRTIGGTTQAEKDSFMMDIILKKDTAFGYSARMLLEKDAEQRAYDAAEAILADDTVSLTELDTLL